MFLIRDFVIEDFDQLFAIYKDAVEKFKIEGTFQWKEGYPSIADFNEDYNNHQILVCEYNDGEVRKVCGAITLIFENEPDYEPGYDVQWINRDPYLTIHRVAVKKEFYGKGVASRLFNKAFELCKEKGYYNIKIDTHEQNYDMKKLLDRLGFKKCGIIKLRKKGEFREAFQKVLE